MVAFTADEVDAFRNVLDALPTELELISYEEWGAAPRDCTGLSVYGTTDTLPLFDGETIMFDDGDPVYPQSLDVYWADAPQCVESFSYRRDSLSDADVIAPDETGIGIDIAISAGSQPETRTVTVSELPSFIDRLSGCWAIGGDGEPDLSAWTDADVSATDTSGDDGPTSSDTAVDVLTPTDEADPTAAFTVSFECGNCGRAFTYGFPADVRVDHVRELDVSRTSPQFHQVGYKVSFHQYEIIECPTCNRSTPMEITDRSPLAEDNDA